ncbi:MAG: M28 family peptidase, partial [Ktedonobacteraceae bacterium]|nr:M28 family peptidase [Ktedonobacteraceae bacterium]
MSKQVTPMREYLQRIASSDPQIRRSELLTILRAIGHSYTLYRDQIAGQHVENIVVRFHRPEHGPRLVLGAHYDGVSGSTGANDNGAAVCILLALLETYKSSPPHLPLDIVFFDLEEQGFLGSQAYIKRFSRTSVLAMINLDICGVGNTLFCAPEKHAKTGVFAQPLQRMIQDVPIPCHVIPILPPGDDTSFEKA